MNPSKACVAETVAYTELSFLALKRFRLKQFLFCRSCVHWWFKEFQCQECHDGQDCLKNHKLFETSKYCQGLAYKTVNWRFPKIVVPPNHLL